MSSDGIVYGGTYANGIVLSNPATQNPATIAATGIVTKQGAFGVAAKYNTAISSEPVTAWSITNYGIIEGLGVNSAGISLAAGSSIDNIGTAALIAGYQDAILISSDAGTISNSGMIEATGSFTNAITLAAGGTVTNTHGAVINAPILIQDGAGTVANSGSLGRGSPALEVSISGGAGVVTNSDVITGGVSLGAGGSVTNADGAAISGGSEIELGGFLLNVPAVDISGGAGTVANSGFLGHGVELHAGGSLTNAEGAVISVGVPSTYHQSQNLVGVSVYGSPGTI
ncbi:MAG: hypothetical protein ACREFK_14265, partial [Stellaceae bacterium]